MKTPLSKRFRGLLTCIIESINCVEEKALEQPESLDKFIARSLLEESEMDETINTCKKLYRIFQSKGRNYTTLKRAELAIAIERSKTDHPEVRPTWVELIPHLRRIIEISESEGRELP